MSDDSDDFDAFRKALGDVRRIRSERIEPRPPRREARPEQRRADEERVLEDLGRAAPDVEMPETGEELLWLKPGLQSRVLKRLRRGHWKVQDEIDLHQMNVAAATSSIRTFLAEARASRHACVKIIHGKGLRSGPGGPRLKAATARVLSRHPDVLAFAAAPPSDGGHGAVYVLLGQRR